MALASAAFAIGGTWRTASAQTKSVPPKTGAAAARPPATSPAPESVSRQRELKSQQQELQSELGRLKRQLAANEKTKVEAADALAASERAISATNRRLRELAKTRARVEAEVLGLQARSKGVAARESAIRRELDELLRQQHQLSLRDPLHLIIEGEDPSRLARDAEYLGYLSRANSETLVLLKERRAELQELESASREKRDQLAQIESQEADSRKALQQEQASRSRTLDELGKQIASQRSSIAKLERDEKRLADLIEQIGRVLAEQAKRDAERAKQAAAAKKSTPSAKPPANVAAAPPPAAQPTPSSGNFALLRGKMNLPVPGSIEARFGTQRRGEAGTGGPTWKGLFIRAPSGTEVRAVGPGRVVFADWLRGFGNLLIVDHGDDYLSVYGNNEALLRNAGDEVMVGETIASVGNTGGNEHPGLYFELRFRGRPFDPLTWTAAR